MSLEVKIGNLILNNPFMPASGTFGSGLEYKNFGDLSKLGAIVTKGVSLKPKIGNKPPRICELPGGMLNSIGLENVGIEKFVDILNQLEIYKTNVVVNFFGNTMEEYIEVAKILDEHRVVSCLEMNISCPNIKEGGMCFGTDPKMVYSLVKEVKSQVKKDLWVKLTPNAGSLVPIAKSAENAGASALVIANTYTGMKVDIRTKKPILGNFFGGYSGPVIKPITLFHVFSCVKEVKIPIIACGGVSTIEDALEYFIVGAKAVQVGTANFTNPGILWELIEELKKYLANEKIKISDLDIKEKIEYVKNLDSELIECDAKIISRIFFYQDGTENKLLINSEGTRIKSTIPRIDLYYRFAVSENGTTLQRYWQYGVAGGFEKVNEWKLNEKLISEAIALKRNIIQGIKSPTGNLEVIVSPEITGIMAHESVGHPYEADRILGRESAQAGESFVEPAMLGTRIGNTIVNVVDDPTVEFSYGYYLYDDEGVQARRKHLIKNGIINEFLHNRESAYELNV
jgi:dihydroorotate dehydrogenase (NAD+) catalytic subunit